jgi:hypothetical protein
MKKERRKGQKMGRKGRKMIDNWKMELKRVK